MYKDSFCSGDKFMLPTNPNFLEDTFIITRTRRLSGSYMLDAVCDGEESISISVNSREVEKVHG